jgi:hypothetical protein
MWGRGGGGSSAAPAAAASAAAAAPRSAPAGVLPREIDAILRGYPVIYKPNGDKFRVEYFKKKIEEIAGSKAFVQRVKADVKEQLAKALAGKVTLSDAPHGYVFDFTV